MGGFLLLSAAEMAQISIQKELQKTNVELLIGKSQMPAMAMKCEKAERATATQTTILIQV